jgi:nucleotide-binding universal stress UspA family protein
MTRTKTIVCGIDSSPGGRAAVRVAALLATQFDARLVAVHVLDRLTAVSQTAERAAAAILCDEAPDAVAVVRGEVGDVAERLAAVARDEGAAMVILGAGSRGRSRTFLRASRAAELAKLTNVPVVVVPFQLVAATATQGVTVHEALCNEHVGDKTCRSETAIELSVTAS